LFGAALLESLKYSMTQKWRLRSPFSCVVYDRFCCIRDLHRVPGISEFRVRFNR
jgi:hypothetical protein